MALLEIEGLDVRFRTNSGLFPAVEDASLTVDNEAQAWARAEEKGRDAARVAVEMATLLDDLS